MPQGQCGYGTSLETIASQRRQEWAIGANLAAFAGAAGAVVDAAEHQARQAVALSPRVVPAAGMAQHHASRGVTLLLVLVNLKLAYLSDCMGNPSPSGGDAV